MDKKQAGIILTLIALIVCAAILSSKVSNDFNGGAGNLSQPVSFNNKGSDNTDNPKNDYFYDAKSTREQSQATTVESLKQVENDENATKENKEKASKAIQQMAENKNNQTKIELQVKAKGFEDSICFIENDKVKVVVKSKEDLTEIQCIQIQDIVKNVTNRSDVMIERKQ